MPFMPDWLIRRIGNPKVHLRKTQDPMHLSIPNIAQGPSVDDLSPLRYDELEALGMSHVSNRVIECSGTVTFSELGYPTRVDSTIALKRYVDVMHEGRGEATFSDFLGGAITRDEFQLLHRVTCAVRDNSLRRYGTKLVSTGSLLRALVIVRAIKILYPEKSSIIFEVGHGSGYVGALLVADGYAYASTDIAQAFYVYQNHLLETLIPGKLTELANDARGFDEIRSIPPGHAVHVPWWKFYSSAPNVNLTVDAVTCNHALAEMHPNGRSYVMALANMMLNKSTGAFVFEGWGSTVNTPIWAVAKRFSDLGYAIAHNNITASIFVPLDGVFAKGALQLPLPHRTDVAFDADLYAPAGFIQQFHPPIYITPASSVSKKFTDGMERLKPKMKVTYADVVSMFRNELGQKDLLSEDERFSAFVGSPY